MLTYEDQYKLAGEIGSMRAHIAWLTEYQISDEERKTITLKLKKHIMNCSAIVCPDVPMPNAAYVSDGVGDIHDITKTVKP